jgi:hypothetical protein
MASTIPLSKTVDYTKRFIYNAPLFFLNSGTLAFSIADDVRQFILSPPFSWRWNRGVVSPITCQPGQTDYQVNLPDFGWIEKAWILFPSAPGNPVQIYNSLNIISISASAGKVTAIVAGNPLNFGFSLGQTISVQNVTDSTFNGFQNLVVSGLGPNSITYSKAGTGSSSTGGLIFNLSPQSMPTITQNGQPLPTKELEVKESLAQESVLGQPAFITAITDDNNGNITFRLQGAPDQAYTLNIIYQKTPGAFSAASDTWAPIPDYLSYLYNEGFLAKALEYKGDERFGYAHQQFLKQVVAANDGLTEEQKSIFLGDRLNVSRESGSLQSSQQARASRGGA